MKNTNRKNNGCFRKFNRLNGGITLIALVITIIVLLILAGVSIAMLTGDNGILTKANQAKKETENATAEEKVKLCVMASYESDGTLSLNELKTQVANEGGNVTGDSFPVTVKMDGNDFTIDSSGKYLDRKEMAEITGNEDKNILTYDSLENQIIVPAGFKVINPTDTVCDGIVVEDVSHTSTAGSQFVWIPVGDVKKSDGTTVNIKLSRYTFDENGQETDYGDNSINNYYQELSTSSWGNTTAKDIEDFKTKSIESKGYYIGRYEARDGVTTSERTSLTSVTNQLVCTPDNYIYNYVTQSQAATLSRTMYNDSNLKSDLMNSYAWDTAIIFLQRFDNRTDNNQLYSRQNSLNTSLAPQGTNNYATQDVICNIYDMASNCPEWTTETSNVSNPNRPCISRGGDHSNSNAYVSNRYYIKIEGSGQSTTFRPVLYL